MRPSDFLARGLIATAAAALIAQAPLVHAEMIGPEAAMQSQSPASQSDQDRAKVQSFLDRANVQQRLQAMGVSGVLAKDRTAALSEEEIHALAQRIDSLPAGGALSTTEWLLIVLIAVLVAIAI